MTHSAFKMDALPIPCAMGYSVDSGELITTRTPASRMDSSAPPFRRSY